MSRGCASLWPTAAVIDWLAILRRVEGIPERAKRLDEAQQILRSRLSFAGTTLRFSTEEDDFWWWLMDSADANAAKLILATLDEPGWKEDLPRLVVGSLARHKRGAWLTTTANLWGSLALDKFAAKFESVPVGGRTGAEAASGCGGVPDTVRVASPTGTAAAGRSVSAERRRCSITRISEMMPVRDGSSAWARRAASSAPDRSCSASIRRASAKFDS